MDTSSIKRRNPSNYIQEIPINPSNNKRENSLNKFLKVFTKKHDSFESSSTNLYLPSSDSNTLNEEDEEHKRSWIHKKCQYVVRKTINAAKFVGPGMMVAIAYMDPGNYSTDVAAGAEKQYALLFVVFLSNMFAIFLQSLATKLGAVTGQDLALNCRNHLPAWLGYVLYFLAECAIIATDIAEVIGTAIALNILLHIPLIAGVILTIVDVLVVLLAYRPGNGMKTVRIFEIGVMILLFGVVICFAVELTHIPKQSVGHIFRGYLPSSDIITGGGIYLSCGVLGATVMPHSLYLGSALVKPRIREYDIQNGAVGALVDETSEDIEIEEKYRPSLEAINHTLTKSIIELAVSLCTVAIFVNSAIIIVAGATMYNNEDAVDADLYGIYRILEELLSKSAAVLFMVALLCSGQSAGIVCTIAGQIVSEGHIRWKFRPWLRRIITRGIAIIPCVIVVAAVGKEGLNAALNASQVALSILLPFLTAPLIYLTSKKEVMTVIVTNDDLQSPTTIDDHVDMSNGIIVKIIGIAVWLFISILNVYLIVLLGLGK